MTEEVLSLSSFVDEFGAGLLDAVDRQNPPIWNGDCPASRDAVLDALARRPFAAQRETIHAIASLLIDENLPAGVINGEMGTGKTLMAIAVAALLHDAGIPRTLVVCPPHLVYKWRREIKQTIPNATVWILNGPDTLRRLLAIRACGGRPRDPEFYVMGRVRMRMGFHWKPAFGGKWSVVGEGRDRQRLRIAICPSCAAPITVPEEDGEPRFLTATEAAVALNKSPTKCQGCGGALWTLHRQGAAAKPRRELVLDALTKLPTIGIKTAHRLVDRFGEDLLGGMLEDNVYEFINLMDEEGDLVFGDRQARRMERALATAEFSFGQGGYQPTEFIKRYLPQGFFGLLIGDEGHEFKNEGSAQGQAFGVLARKCRKALLLTGTLMGGYADDLFYLLWRLNPRAMIEDGFGYNARNSLATASLAFMREHGVVKDIYKECERDEGAHRTAKGRQITHRTAKGPGFGPKGIMRFVVPMTAFVRLKDIDPDVLPPYDERFDEVPMEETQGELYARLETILKGELRTALRKGDHSLLGVVLNALLAWPDCAFRAETVMHPHTRRVLASLPAIAGEGEPLPKEHRLIEICRRTKAAGRRTLVYTVYTGTRDTSARLKQMLEAEGFKVGVLRASVDAAQREDWLADQVERGVDVVVTNPELVKTGLDMLEFPTIVFMQSGYNVYTLQQASRRSWRIGQRLPVEVHFLGYAGSAQMACLELMSKKIAVSQSTSGDTPDSGLDVLNQSGDSIEVALAKRLTS